MVSPAEFRVEVLFLRANVQVNRANLGSPDPNQSGPKGIPMLHPQGLSNTVVKGKKFRVGHGKPLSRERKEPGLSIASSGKTNTKTQPLGFLKESPAHA